MNANLVETVAKKSYISSHVCCSHISHFTDSSRTKWRIRIGRKRNISHLTGMISRWSQHPLGQPTRWIIGRCPGASCGRTTSAQGQSSSKADRNPGLGWISHGFTGCGSIDEVVGGGVMPENRKKMRLSIFFSGKS